jgi:uncharacterized protein (DUF1810 family)
VTDLFGLDRFVAAQDEGDIYAQALAEISAGRKRSHWMWFVFPQHVSLGQSPIARRYGIGSVEEARAYLAHPVLGPRLHACVAALGKVPDPDPVMVFGHIDAMKLRSSLTLFEAAGGGAAFAQALDRWYAGARDPATIAAISS